MDEIIHALRGPFYLVGILCLAIGIFFSVVKIRRNRWGGVRLPWTYADEEIWHKANRLAGVLSIVLGLLFFFSQLWAVAGLVVLIPAMIIYPAVLYRRKYDTLRTEKVGKGWLSIDYRPAKKYRGRS